MIRYTVAWRERFGDDTRPMSIDAFGLSELAVGGIARGLANTTGISDVIATAEHSTTRQVFP